MHTEVEDFLNKTDSYLAWTGCDVIEVGAQDVNGATRYLIPGTPASWTGIDLVPGPGVDYAGKAEDILPLIKERFDIAVSTEVLEHAPGWRNIVIGMVNVLHPGGHLVITCAAPGRPEHGASGGGRAADEWYENVAVADLARLAQIAGCDIVYQMQRGAFPQDTYLIAQKRNR